MHNPSKQIDSRPAYLLHPTCEKQTHSDTQKPSRSHALGGEQALQTKPAAPFLHDLSSFSAKWRPDQEGKADRWCPADSPSSTFISPLAINSSVWMDTFMHGTKMNNNEVFNNSLHLHS